MLVTILLKVLLSYPIEMIHRQDGEISMVPVFYDAKGIRIAFLDADKDVRFSTVVEAINAVAGTSDKGWMKAVWQPDDGSQLFNLWFPKLAEKKQGKRVAAAFDCLNTISDDWNEIVYVDLKERETEQWDIYQGYTLVFAKEPNGGPYIFRGVYVADALKTRPNYYVLKRVGTKVYLKGSPAYDIEIIEKPPDEMQKDVISFPCGDTYDFVRQTRIHSHPVKKGYPTRRPKYLMIRESGGVSHELFRVVDILEFNPYDEEFIKTLNGSLYQNRIREYINLRNRDYKFQYAPEYYRFYVLETVLSFDPPFILDKNTQSHRYLSFKQLGLSYEDVESIEISCLEKDLGVANIPGNDRLTLIKGRVNQGIFRDKLLHRYGKCCLCNVTCSEMLISSHIKPWSESEAHERLDVDNGLLLCPGHDRLFDKGYISFDDDGKILISEALDDINRMYMNVRADMEVSLTEGNKRYMQFHRANIFLDRDKKRL